MEDASKLWNAVRYKMKKLENSVGIAGIQIQALEEEEKDFLFDTEDIVELHQNGKLIINILFIHHNYGTKCKHSPEWTLLNQI